MQNLGSKNSAREDGYNRVNLRVGYEREKFDVYVWCKNLFDEAYLRVRYAGSGSDQGIDGDSRDVRRDNNVSVLMQGGNIRTANPLTLLHLRSLKQNCTGTGISFQRLKPESGPLPVSAVCRQAAGSAV